jgi:TetR/AcrR family transcriptional regulator
MVSVRPARAAKLSAAARRQQILEVAIRAFAERGFAGASTLAIAAAAGVGEPTIYRYFASKRDLYLAAVDRCSSQILERWRAIAAESASPLEAIERIGAWYLGQLAARPDDLLLRYRSLSHHEDPETSARVRDRYRETLAFVADLYRRARERGDVPESVDPDAQAWIFIALGAAFDQAQLLGLGDALTPDVLRRLVSLLRGVETSATTH